MSTYLLTYFINDMEDVNQLHLFLLRVNFLPFSVCACVCVIKRETVLDSPS